MKQILQQARDTYGNKNQIMVCIEELNELAAVLAKYPRYKDEHKAVVELYNRVLDETADVLIILEHVKAIFHLQNEALADQVSLKVARLERWLDESDHMEQTTIDRELK